jgi:hypothetical protein
MKSLLLYLFALVAITFKCFSQETQIAEGYKLRRAQYIVYAYRDANSKPDLSVRNRWNHVYWFKVDKTKKGSYTDSVTKEEYVRITIPSSRRFDDKKNDWVYEDGYDTTIDWKNEGLVDGSDFNAWLWIRKIDFENLGVNYYPSIKGSFVLSGLTAPFKFRPSTGSQPNSVINGDINLGSFIGVRLAKDENFGLSVGGHFGISSVSLNASNNTSLSGNSTETIQGLTYGYGAIVDLRKQFQIGLIGGFDYGLGNLSKTYVYQNKNWLSFSLNYKFLDFGKKTDTNEKQAKKKNE